MARDITSSGFTIVLGAKDDISGIARYECYINGEKKGESETETITITELSPNTPYDNIAVKVYNNAGIASETLPISVKTKQICYTTYCAGGTTINCSSCSGCGRTGNGLHSMENAGWSDRR